MSAPAIQYAGFWYRALALLIDWILANILGILVVLPLSFVLGMAMVGHEPEVIGAAGALMGMLVGTAVMWLYIRLPDGRVHRTQAGAARHGGL